MTRDEAKIFRHIDWGVYIIFIPIIFVLIPTDRIAERDPYFFVLMVLYVLLIHNLGRRFNFTTYIFKREHHKAVLSISLVVIITYFATKIQTVDLYDSNSTISIEQLNRFRTRVLCTLCFVDICFSIMFGLLAEVFRQKMERRDIENEKGKAELAIYKSQINPHFMFNTLNTIYALNFTHSERTGEVIMKFSNIVKYIYQNCDKESIMIVDEVKYLKEFIDIHTLRLSDQTRVEFRSEVDDDSQYVPSMIFITFIENVFKYGVSSSESSTIDIRLELKNRVLNFSTSNRIFTRDDASSGIGIENCRKRLSLLYPDRHHLKCSSDGEIFKTTLKIEL
ncbi:MAG: histidine kinase [Rikenellaceae bacterium]